jgi:hypothetical protein
MLLRSVIGQRVAGGPTELAQGLECRELVGLVLGDVAVEGDVREQLGEQEAAEVGQAGLLVVVGRGA